MIAAISLLVVLTLSLLITRIATIALDYAGLSREAVAGGITTHVRTSELPDALIHRIDLLAREPQPYPARTGMPTHHSSRILRSTRSVGMAPISS